MADILTKMNILTWIIAGISLVGVIFNIKKMRICFLVWIVSNCSWAVIDFVMDIPAQGVLFTIYACLAVWGYIVWGKDKKIVEKYYGGKTRKN